MSIGTAQRAAWLLTASLLASSALAGDEPRSFSIGLHGSEHATLADLGLPGYPGAMPYSEGEGDKSAVSLGAWAGAFGLHVSALKFQVAEDPILVAAFYAKALGHHGRVLDCREPAARVKPPKDDKTDRMTCDETPPAAGAYEFRVGTGKQFRVVYIRPHGKGARFEMARVSFGN